MTIRTAKTSLLTIARLAEFLYLMTVPQSSARRPSTLIQSLA
jgi:hypothetical protein